MSLDPPAYLDDQGRTLWTELRAEALAAGTTARLNADRLAELVSITLQHRRATALLASSDVLINRDGVPTENPARPVQRDASRRMRELRRELGLTRATTPAITQPPPTQPDNTHTTAPNQGRYCDEHARWECTRERSRGRGCCHGPAVAGTPACRMHLGSSPATNAAHIAAVERRANPLAGEPYDIAPGEALLWRVRVLAGEVRRLDGKIAAIDEDDLVWGDTEVSVMDGENPVTRTTSGARLNMWVQLRAQRERQLQSACEAALRAGVEQALVELARDQIAFMHRVIAVALARFAGIPEDDPRLAAELPAIILEIAG